MRKKTLVPMLLGSIILCTGCCNLSLLDISCKNPFQRTQVVVPCSPPQPYSPQPTYYVLKRYEPPRVQVIEMDSSNTHFYEPLPFANKE